MAQRRRVHLIALIALPVVTVAVSLAVLLAAERADVPSPAQIGSVGDQVTAYLHDQRVALGVPAMSLAIVRDGRVTTSWADGEARPGQPMTPNTPVLLASVSKQFTALAVMELVDAGKIDLDRPVVSYLRWFRTSDSTASAEITVAQLLHHTSGLTDDAIFYRQFGDSSAAALQQGIHNLADADLAQPPGKKFLYSNTNYNILGALVESVSGQPFAAYLQQHVFSPLGMTNAAADPNGDVAGRAATGYYRWFGVHYRPTDVPRPASSSPSATSYASAEDLAKILLMNLGHGRQLLSASALRQLHRPAAATEDWATAYAMGWQVRPLWEPADPTRFGDRPSTTLPLVWEHQGSWPTTTTYLGFSPQLDTGFVLLMNGHDRAASSLQYAVSSNVWRILNKTPATSLGQPNEEPLDRYGSVVALTLIAIQLAMLAGAVLLVRRGTRIGRRRRLIAAVLMLAFDVALMGFIWLYLPASYQTPVTQIASSAPDIGLIIWLTTALAVVWGVTRTVLLVRRAKRGLPSEAT